MSGLSPEDVRRVLDDMPSLAIGPSALVGVIPVAKVVDAAGLSVELLSVEIRKAGAFVHWRCRAGQSRGFLMPRVSVSDDRSTEYMVSTASGGGDDRFWSGAIALNPSPPSDCVLSISISAFGVDADLQMPGWIAGPDVEGPWLFDVQTGDMRVARSNA